MHLSSDISLYVLDILFITCDISPHGSGFTSVIFVFMFFCRKGAFIAVILVTDRKIKFVIYFDGIAMKKHVMSSMARCR